MWLDSGHAYLTRGDRKVVYVQGKQDARRKHQSDAIDAHHKKGDAEDTFFRNT